MGESVPVWPKKQKRSEDRKNVEDIKTDKYKTTTVNIGTTYIRWKYLMTEKMLSSDAQVSSYFVGQVRE